MKKIMAILTLMMLVMPFTGVKAATKINGSVRDYEVGDEINFYRNDEEKATGNENAGQSTIVLSTERVDGKYLRVLAIAPFGGTDPYYDSEVETTPMTVVKKAHISDINEKSADFPWSAAKDLESTLTYMSLDEVIKVFGATKNGDEYSISVEKWGETFDFAAVSNYVSEGFFTSTYDIDDDYVWVVDFDYDSEDIETKNINKITVKKVEMEGNTTYGYLPVVYFDETYDCHYDEEDISGNYACYSCDDEYLWAKIGDQAESCTLVDTVSKKADCVVAPQTGLEDYIVEFLIVAGVCGLALIAVKRKELFRGV